MAAPHHIDPKSVDFDVVSHWMDEQGLPGGQLTDISAITGGTQNIMVRFSRGGREYVLRRPPKHLREASNNVIRREARLLGALRGQGVPAPELIAACTDETVLGGAVFYLMEPVDGFNASVGLPELHAGNAEIRHQMGLEAVSGIAALGALDYQELGLDGYGNPDGFLERQVPRWLKELDSYAKHDGYPGPDIPGLQSVANWLERHRPSQWKPGIMHGDFHLANMMFRNDGPQLAAIVDWEMSTIGDPLLDLGWMLATWPSETDDASLVARWFRPGPAHTAGACRALRGTHGPRSRCDGLVHGVGVLQARHHPGGHTCPRVRRESTCGGGGLPARTDVTAVQARGSDHRVVRSPGSGVRRRVNRSIAKSSRITPQDSRLVHSWVRVASWNPMATRMATIPIAVRMVRAG
ncbi:phosphotransferase enzyme family protein [Mycobacteroides abscessus MAB_110811_2726]|nr:phosphotransferase enzyme family protein [Mycobacteroides abscessus MAB_110811_2726]